MTVVAQAFAEEPSQETAHVLRKCCRNQQRPSHEPSGQDRFALELSATSVKHRHEDMSGSADFFWLGETLF